MQLNPQQASTADIADFAPRVIAWQRQHGRHDLPWQQNPDPYCVWLSEIMLQQTQVATVLAYYQRFLQTFPTVADLAAAAPDAVMQLWAGLGYYSRARNLHRAAQMVVAEFAGQFPQSAADLQRLPGPLLGLADQRTHQRADVQNQHRTARFFAKTLAESTFPTARRR